MRLEKKYKARKKIKKILDKYDCNYFEIIELEPIDRKYKVLKELAKNLRFKLIPIIKKVK